MKLKVRFWTRIIRRSSQRNNNWLIDRCSSLSNACNTASTESGPGGSCPCSRIWANASRADWLRLKVFGIVGFYGMFNMNAILPSRWGRSRKIGFPIINSLLALSASALQREFLRNGPVRLYENQASVFLRQIVSKPLGQSRVYPEFPFASDCIHWLAFP